MKFSLSEMRVMVGIIRGFIHSSCSSQGLSLQGEREGVEDNEEKTKNMYEGYKLCVKVE